MRNKKEQDLTLSAWNSFVKTGSVNEGIVRQEILASWRRCRSFGLDPINPTMPENSPDKLEKQLKANESLIQIVKSYMENLYLFLKGSGYVIKLSSSDGYVIHMIGIEEENPDSTTKFTKQFLGAPRCEKIVGSNSVGICLVIDKPFSVQGTEHYVKDFHNWTSSAAPIHDPSGNIIGALNISSTLEKYNPHTLGMVVAAVDGIEKEIRLHSAYRNITLMNSQLESTLKSIEHGVILLDNTHKIIQINDAALRPFKLASSEIIGHSLDEFIIITDTLLKVIDARENIYDKEITFTYLNGSVFSGIVTAIIVKDSLIPSSIVLSFKASKSVHKLVNRMTGARAKFTFNDIMGNAPAFLEAKSLAQIAAKTSSNVLLLGESGVGKELFAQSIHNASERKNGPFVAINCGALPRTLIESELFGYEGGSFTGSKKDGHPGKFELAHKGTIFLDEIGDMPIDTQISLLRVLQAREVIRVGGIMPKAIDVKIIAATHVNLLDAITHNTFRQDLYYRLNVFSIHIPPLRDSKSDIILIANYFLEKYSLRFDKNSKYLSNDAIDALTSYDWPGNTRELENVIEGSIHLSQSDCITLKDMPQYFIQKCVKQNSFREDLQTKTTKNTEHAAQNFAPAAHSEELDKILSILEETGGNMKAAADLLGMSRRNLYRKMNKYNIDYSQYRKL